MFWTDDVWVPSCSQNPKDAMTLMDFYYQPDVQAVVEYYNDYVCPVPAAQQVLLHPTGWAEQTLKAMHPSIGLPYATTANAPTVFPDAEHIKLLQELLQVQVPGRTDGVEQPVPADHPGRVTHSEGVAPTVGGVTRRRRARPGKVLAPYLLALPGGLWLFDDPIPGSPGGHAVAVPADRRRAARVHASLGGTGASFPGPAQGALHGVHPVRIWYAGIATCICLVVSFPLAYWIAFYGGKKNFFLLCCCCRSSSRS